MSKSLRTALIAAALVAAAPGSAHAAAPLVETLVVAKNGETIKQGEVRAAKTTVKLGRKKCAVPQGTALAALTKLKPGRIGLADYGECSTRTVDASGLYVRSIGRDKARGTDGWVYKVGRKSAPAGAADPTGPFGRGLIKSGQRVLWFYCEADDEGGCQRTLELTAKPADGGVVNVTVKGYDNAGKGVAIEGADVTAAGAGAAAAVTDGNGKATLQLGAGEYTLVAGKNGLVRSFTETITLP
jgi:hypothetical protein